MTLDIGHEIPDLELATTAGPMRLGQLRGRPLVLFFYPRANTPGCTQEGQDFRDAMPEFAALDTVLLGASRDSLKAQTNFKTKHGFPFELVSDPDEVLCRAFDVIKLKKLYGRESLGVERSTFLVDADGVLRQAWRKVKVKGHVVEVLEALRAAVQKT